MPDPTPSSTEHGDDVAPDFDADDSLVNPFDVIVEFGPDGLPVVPDESPAIPSPSKAPEEIPELGLDLSFGSLDDCFDLGLEYRLDDESIPGSCDEEPGIGPNAGYDLPNDSSPDPGPSADGDLGDDGIGDEEALERDLDELSDFDLSPEGEAHWDEEESIERVRREYRDRELQMMLDADRAREEQARRLGEETSRDPGSVPPSDTIGPDPDTEEGDGLPTPVRVAIGLVGAAIVAVLGLLAGGASDDDGDESNAPEAAPSESSGEQIPPDPQPVSTVPVDEPGASDGPASSARNDSSAPPADSGGTTFNFDHECPTCAPSSAGADERAADEATGCPADECAQCAGDDCETIGGPSAVTDDAAVDQPRSTAPADETSAGVPASDDDEGVPSPGITEPQVEDSPDAAPGARDDTGSGSGADADSGNDRVITVPVSDLAPDLGVGVGVEPEPVSDPAPDLGVGVGVGVAPESDLGSGDDGVITIPVPDPGLGVGVGVGGLAG